MLRIVTDGGADMPDGWEKEYEIDLLPLMVRFNEDIYQQGKNLTKELFYRLAKEGGVIPKTSLPSPNQIMDFFRKIAQKGDDVLSIHIGGKMSGTFAAVQMAAREIAGEIKVYPFDSGAGSAALGFMCREARRLSRSGYDIQHILGKMERMREQVTVVFTLDTLEFARMNGRINSIQSTISSLLKIKPIIMLKDGLLQIVARVSTRNRSIERVVEIVTQQINRIPVNVAVVHACDPGIAQILVEKVKARMNIRDLVVTDLSIPVAANLGPGAVGIIAFPAEEED